MRIPVATVILLAVLSACGSATSGSPVAGGAPSSSSAAPETSTSTPTSTSSSGGGVGKACDFTTDPNAEVPAGKNVGLPPAKATPGQPHSGGSQFFIVYADSTLPPAYAVFGTIDAASLSVIDKIAAAGIGAASQGPGDGSPKNPVTIQRAVVRS